jgi:uncharacterized protein (DUF2252 family)
VDRRALGVRARKQVARSAHADFSASACSHSPLDLIHRAERDRIPHLLVIKHERMAASPFGFFRGAVPVMAADLACHPNTGLTTQICGDAHGSNLGAYAAADGRLVFDINDFDETIRGPFEFDLKRLATSLLLAGREAGVGRSGRRDAVLYFAAQYRRQMAEFAVMPVLELARYQIHRLAHIDPMPAILRQAERSTPQRALKALTRPAAPSAGHGDREHSRSAERGVVRRTLKLGGHLKARRSKTAASEEFQPATMESQLAGPEEYDPRSARIFRSEPPLLERLSSGEAATVLNSLGSYARTLQPERRHFLDQYTPRDVAFKVVGTGSVGLRDYCIYFEGTQVEGSPNHDPLFLQIKEEPRSAYAPYLPEGDSHSHQGHRVVDGQRAMQLTSDPFLGYTTIDGRDYLVRQLNDHKATLDLKTLTAESLLGYADLCGELFARGHARAGDPVAFSAYLGSSDRFDRALLGFAHSYADKTEKDWKAFKKSLKNRAAAKENQPTVLNAS